MSDDNTDFNTKIIDEFRANEGKVGGPFEGATMVVITHTGAKSGQPRTTPLVYLEDDDRIVIFASNAGAPNHPSWFHNILANPRVTVELGTETFEAEAEIHADGPERDQLFERQATLMPGFRDYEQKTDRTIPVVVLRRT